MNLPELSRDERAALAFLMRTAAKFGPEKCWPTIYSIGLAIGKKRRSVSTILTALAAFGMIERIARGSRATRYRIALTFEELNLIFCAAYKNDCAAFCAAVTNSSKVTEIKLVRPRNSRANCAASPSLCPPTPQARTSPMSEMPDYYASDPGAQKLWRMAQRWIAINDPDLSEITGDKARPIMYALEAAGALNLAEDGPLPMIAWPALDSTPLFKLAQAIERKPVRSLTADEVALARRKIAGTE